MRRTTLLKADAAINLILGILLMAFPAKLVTVLAIPMADPSFYPTILGGVLFGIGLALLIECYRRPNRFIGLGLAGAVRIDSEQVNIQSSAGLACSSANLAFFSASIALSSATFALSWAAFASSAAFSIWN
jgi:hypothetical protein